MCERNDAFAKETIEVFRERCFERHPEEGDSGNLVRPCEGDNCGG